MFGLSFQGRKEEITRILINTSVALKVCSKSGLFFF